ncbi:MAG: hypothetical protein K0R45_2572 [Pseudomonas sp.]|jgi:flagellar protein FlhE|nr:hypothetical protein [Pseudomonas sp.]
MKCFKELKGFLLPMIIVAAAVNSQAAFAGSYVSVVNLPVLHAKGHTYRANIPLPGGPRPGQLIKHVGWNWNVHGWPRGLQVFLCQTASKCLDVSRLRSGGSAEFNNFSATSPFYFELKLSQAGPAPVAGQQGKITVTWG